jgi:hypothetical protein
MPKVNRLLNKTIYEIVDGQLREGTPPETKETYKRLLADGTSPQEARRLIACVVVNEIYCILHDDEPYNETRFIAALRKLPKMPWEE